MDLHYSRLNIEKNQQTKNSELLDKSWKLSKVKQRKKKIQKYACYFGNFQDNVK